MPRIALTGGIGSGKSTVARLLAGHGALVVDADAIAREIVRPGRPALAEIADRFGPGVIRADGALDRAALAAVVFADDAALAALNAITHPRIARRTAELLAAAPAQAVVVYDMPLLVEQGDTGRWDHVVVVETPLELRLQRLARDRDMTREQALARIAAQASDAQRRAVADTVLVNDTDEAALAARVDALWPRLTG